jgi:hypothetical protein
MMTKLSHVFSWMFLPLLMPLYALLIVLFVPSSPVDVSETSAFLLPTNLKWLLWTVFLIFCFIAPGISFYGLYRMGIITTLDMEARKERKLPLLIMLGYNLLLIWFVYRSDPRGVLPNEFIQLPVAGLLVTMVFTVVSSFLKISMHAGGCGILTGFLFGFYRTQHDPSLFWMSVAVLVSGCVIASRWYLGKHRAIELLLGYAVAAIITVLVL